MKSLIVFILTFLIGELLINFSVFKYLKRYFQYDERKANSEENSSKPFQGMDLSIVNGILERFTIYFCLVIGLPQVLIVFGAIKIGTRLEKTKEVTNDYFLVGNFISILTSAIYFYLYLKITM
jgi:hypothetical protein